MNTPAVPARQQIDQLVAEVERRRAELLIYLPEGVKPERFMALARRAIFEQPQLAECSATSVLRALRECALSGLELDGSFSMLIVRKSKSGTPTATWDATFRGMIWQALASGYVRNVNAEIVRELDEFVVEHGSEPKLVHRPCVLKARGAIVAAYAIAELTSGAKLIEVLTREDIDRIRAASPAGEKGPWGSWSDEMARKSAIRRLLKKLPAGSIGYFDIYQNRPLARALGYNVATQPAAAGAEVTKITSTSARAELLPEEQHALECAALEKLSVADTIGELDAAWAQAQLEFSQRGAAVPLAVEARWHDLRESLSGQIT